ncbi:unnamed protein product [Trichogramma brassicae]|uniref:Rab-like protein 3 n=1 Tax=Trichogramma brassicae TaxID=86971 RepID=A0A6H5I5Y1_9HYME|nr:unnamed protein product [Trichogramma brassicae]
MAGMDKVKIIVVGVGKSSLTHLICHQEPMPNPSWTVGCTADVILHEYKEGTPNQRRFFVELWDIGGRQSHKNTRSVYYSQANGIILVHDLTNRKSQQNLQKWLEEVLNKNNNHFKSKSYDDFDPEKFVGSTQIPILVVGTKADMVAAVRSNVYRRASTIAEECGADEIFLDCRQSRTLAAGSTSSLKLSRFFDKVIDRRYQFSKDTPADQRRIPIFASQFTQKLYHND